MSEALEQLQNEIAGLKEAIETERAQVAEAIGKLTTTIDELNQKLSTGITADEVAGLVQQLQEATTSLSTIIPDAPASNEATGG